MNVPYVILGHSERRHTVAEESNQLIADKTVVNCKLFLKTCLANGLKVSLCIGELKEEREANQVLFWFI